MMKACVVAALTLIACGAELEESVVDVALNADDQCAAGEEGARCALNALQIRAAQASEVTEGNACTQGVVGEIRAYGESCFDSCPQMCHPLDLAVTAFLTKGGAPAVKPVVCAHQSDFSCALSGANLHKCQPLITQAASFGFKIPDSVDKLHHQCASNALLQIEAAQDAEAIE